MIPQTLFYFWDGPDPEPENPRQWDKFLPGWRIIRLTAADVRHPQVEELIKAGAWASLADAARVQALATHGGVFLDIDFTLCRPLDSLREKAFVCVEGQSTIANSALGAEAGNLFFTTLAERIRTYDLVSLSRQGICNVAGPVMVSGLWREMYGDWPEDVCEKGCDRPEIGVRILPKRFFYPYSWNEPPCPPFPDSYGLHEWAARWKKP